MCSFLFGAKEKIQKAPGCWQKIRSSCGLTLDGYRALTQRGGQFQKYIEPYSLPTAHTFILDATNRHLPLVVMVPQWQSHSLTGSIRQTWMTVIVIIWLSRLALCFVPGNKKKKKEDCIRATNGACCQSMQHPVPDASRFALSRCWQAARHRVVNIKHV